MKIKNFFKKPTSPKRERRKALEKEILKSLKQNGTQEVKFNNEFKTNATISFVASFRYRGNENEHNPRFFFESLIENASNLETIEILIAIDSDDNLQYFKAIENIYQPIIKNLKFFVSPKRFGYQGLHFYDKFLYQFLSTNSRMISDFSDDCQIVLKNFDDYLMKIDNSIEDNIYFIVTGNLNIEKYIGECEGNIAKTIWKCQAIGPSCYFPIVSRKVLEVGTKALELLDDEKQKDWAPLTNAWSYDVYIDVILNFFPFKSKNRVFNLHMIDIMTQFSSEKRNLKINFDKEMKIAFTKYGLTPNDMSFIKLLEPATQKHLEIIAKNLYDLINANETKQY